MKKCDRCYFENPDDAEKCINCGKELPKVSIPQNKINLEIQESPSKNSNQMVLRKQEKKPIENNNIEPELKHETNDYYVVEYRGKDSNSLNMTKNIESEKRNKNNLVQNNKNNNEITNKFEYEGYYKLNFNNQQQNTSNINIENIPKQNTKIKKPKKMWLTLLLSLLFIGFGHFYLGKYLRGLIFLAFALITGYLSLKYHDFIYIWLMISIYQIIDAALCCERINKSL